MEDLAGLADKIRWIIGDDLDLADVAAAMGRLAPLVRWAASGCDPDDIDRFKVRRPDSSRLAADLAVIGAEAGDIRSVLNAHVGALARPGGPR